MSNEDVKMKKLLNKMEKRPSMLRELGIDPSHLDDLKEIADERIQMRKDKAEREVLKYDKGTARIHINKNMTDYFIECFNRVEAYNKDLFKKCKIKKGYITLDISDILKVNMPEITDELMYVVQHHTGNELLERFNSIKENIYRRWGSITIYYEIDKGTVRKLDVYVGTGEKFSELYSTYNKAVKNMLENRPLGNIEFNMMFENSEEEGNCTFGIEPKVMKECTYLIVGTCTALLYVIMSYMIGTEEDYQVTRENLNEKIKKKDNYRIDLNREVKQLLKKEDTPIYYIEKE
ncbi:hypothetical protein [uncultured Clostridium sp.]|uniref:hypothetical protein n=1 Tax=uncultured Clostridium sp. TaxID=59620 RepID=UPI0026F0FA85|nr:hypothetical protein [uncultured Clostridium sp.]